MKELEIIENSITPFWMKDLGYLQNGIKESICAICESFKPTGRQFMIVQGCDLEFNPSVPSISTRGGWVYYRGILYPVKNKALISKSSNPTVYLNLVQNYDTSGKRNITIGDRLQFKDLYRDDYLEISLEKTQSSIGAITPGAWDLSERIVKQSKLTDSGWVNADWTTDNAADKDSSTCIQYRWIGNIVQLSGKIDVQGNITVPNLPVPSKDFCCIRLINKDSIFRKRIDIKANNNYGELTVGPQASGEVSLDDIVYTTDTYYTGNLNDGHMTL